MMGYRKSLVCSQLRLGASQIAVKEMISASYRDYRMLQSAIWEILFCLSNIIGNKKNEKNISILHDFIMR